MSVKVSIFEMSFWCHRFNQIPPKNVLSISALSSLLKRLNQKINIDTLFFLIIKKLCIWLGTFLIWSLKQFRWYFGRNKDTKRTFWNQLTCKRHNQPRRWHPQKKGLGGMGFPCTKNVLEQNQDNSIFLDSKRLHTD